MRLWQKKIISAITIVILFGAIGTFYNVHKVENAKQNLMESALFIAEPLWNFDIEMMEGYLQNKLDTMNLKTLSVYDNEGNLFIDLSLKRQSKTLSILSKIHLIPEVNLQQEVVQNKMVIGNIEVVWLDDSIILYSYLLIPASLLYVISYLYINMLEAKKSIEIQFQKAKKQKDYIEEIFNIVPEGIVTLDAEKNSLGNNRSFDEIITYWSEVSGQSFDQTKTYFIEQLAEQSDLSNSGQYSMFLGEHTINIDFTAAEIPSVGDVSKLISLRDTSKLVAMERQLAQAQKLEAVGRLAAGVAHEINTPAQYVLTNIDFLIESNNDISDFINSLEDTSSNNPNEDRHEELSKQLEEIDWEFLKDEIPDALNQAKDGLQRISKIVTAMKHFSHPSGEDPELNDINNALENTISVARNEWKYIAETELDLDPDLPLIPCFLDQLNQVFLVMIINGAHAIAEKFKEGDQIQGKITLKTSCRKGQVFVSISDNGNGMPGSVKSKIFDPFFTTKEVNKGTGQGLAIAHDIILNKHNGSIAVDSEEGIGTTFTITLPCVHDESASS